MKWARQFKRTWRDLAWRCETISSETDTISAKCQFRKKKDNRKIKITWDSFWKHGKTSGKKKWKNLKENREKFEGDISTPNHNIIGRIVYVNWHMTTKTYRTVGNINAVTQYSEQWWGYEDRTIEKRAREIRGLNKRIFTRNLQFDLPTLKPLQLGTKE